MSTTTMEPLAMWGHNTHSRSKGQIQVPASPSGTIHSYVCYTVPRTMLRSAASLFSDVRHTELESRYDEITLQLFLQMLYRTANLEDDALTKVDVFPYMKAWLEWIPSATLPDNAVAYRIHAVSLHPKVNFGVALSSMLYETQQMHHESVTRKQNSRKTDPIAGLQSYQKWMRVQGMEMYVRTICDRYSKSQDFTDRLDAILNPKISISDPQNAAHPESVFNLERALEATPETADPAFRQRTNYTMGDVGMPVGQLFFCSDKHVLRLTPAQLHPKVFCAKYLPDFQLWIETQKALPPKVLGTNNYDPDCQNEYDVRTPQDIERARLQGLADRSAFSELATQAKATYALTCAPLEGTPAYDQAYADYQDWACRAMDTQCLDPDACISEVGSKILMWRQKNAMSIQHVITDPTLSVFANRVIALMEGYEQYYLISTAHRMMYLVQHARYDAFRRDFGLHFNCFQAGDGATSKSFLFKLMEWMSIPGSVEVLSYQTGKSDAVDGNKNDVCTVCHEAPPGMFRTSKNPNADSSQEAMFKEKLTRQEVTCKTWCMDEATGKRSSRVTKSECVGVWMGATNDPPSEVEEALKTRFFWGNFEQQRRPGRDIDDCMNGERMMSTADKAHRKRMFREGMEEQYRVFLVEKNIWCGVIRDVDTTACNILIPRFKAKMSKNSIIRPGPRDWERVKIFARNQAIVTAIETVFNMPGGEHYGEEFEEKHVPSLEPYLRVTEEMVIFTLSLLADQFRSPIEHKILNTIWLMEKANPTTCTPNQETGCNYLKLPRLRQLAKKVNSRIPLEKGRTSTNNIEDFLNRMTRHTIRCRNFKPKSPGADVATDNYPVPNDSGSERQHTSCIITHEGVFIHMHHILAHASDSSDSVYDTLAAETHAYSNDKRLITATLLGPKWYHAFKVIERTAGGKGLEYHNVLWNTSTSRWITQTDEETANTRKSAGYSIDCDIDEHVAKRLSKRIGKAVDTPVETMQKCIDAENYPRPPIQYPNTFVKEMAMRKKRMRDSSDDDAAPPTKKLVTCTT